MAAMMQGRLYDALKEYDVLSGLLQSADDDPEQFEYTANRMLLESELGDQGAAAQTLARYVSARHAFQRDVDGGDNVIYLYSLATEFGFMSWHDWGAKRDERLARTTERDVQLDGRARRWLDDYAMPAVTPAGAKEALDQLPHFLPILHRSDRWYWDDHAIARVYALTGQDEAAIPYYERATRSCGALKELIQFRHAESDFADFLVRRGDTNRACALYGRVLSAWPVSSRSIVAEHAASQTHGLCRTFNKKEKPQ
jgi:hypothetical protein